MLILDAGGLQIHLSAQIHLSVQFFNPKRAL